MEIECCSLDDDDMYASLEKFPRESNWNGHKICVEGDGISHLLKPMEAKASGEAKIDISWGDGNTKVSVGVSGQIQDNKGNYVEIEVKRNNEGTGNATITAGHETTGHEK